MQVDPRTPVIVGVGQFTERIDDPGYQGLSASRFMALATDEDLVSLMSDGDPMGARIEVKSTDDGTNRARLA